MQLLIMKVIMSSNGYFSRIGLWNTEKKQLDFICPGLDFVSWTVHKSSIIKKILRSNY